MEKKLFVFDFDYSLINVNSDTYIFKELEESLYEEIRQEYSTASSWLELIDSKLLKLQETFNHSEDEIKKVLGTMPYFKEIKDIFEYLKSKEAYIVVASDANEFFIRSFLEINDFSKYIDEIHTNKSVKKDGFWRIEPYTPKHKPHGCDKCHLNQCKGLIIDGLWEKLGKIETFYVGDGGNDLCPGLRLKKEDSLFVRGDKEFKHGLGLYKKVKKHGVDNFDCEIVFWKSMAEILKSVKFKLKL